MTKKVLLLYLFLVLLILAFIQIGIRTGVRPDMKDDTEEAGFKPMAQKIKEAKILMLEARKNVKLAEPNEAHDETVYIEPGKFRMGDEEGPFDQKPERIVYLDGFFIDKYETTFAQFYRFISATGHREPRLAGYLAVDSKELHRLMNPSNAVTGISWYDAEAFCSWKGKRLPTEAEWEKAARGEAKIQWPWGNEGNSGFANLVGRGDGFPYLSPVGAFPRDRSPYGLYDMAGNAMEWVSDWYQEDYYQVAPPSNPVGPGREGFRVGPGRVGFKVIRGASWNDAIARSKTTIRFKAYPSYRDVTIGFRCAKQA